MRIDFLTKASDFLCGYLNISDEYKTKNGLVKEECLKPCFDFLIERGVFTKEELKKETIKYYGFIIPDEWIS